MYSFVQSSALFPCENDILKINDYLEKKHFLLYFTSKQYLRLIYFLGFSRHLFLFFSFDYSHFILCICYRIKIDWSIYSHLKQLVLAMHIHVFDIDDFSIFLCDRVLFLKKIALIQCSYMYAIFWLSYIYFIDIINRFISKKNYTLELWLPSTWFRSRILIISKITSNTTNTAMYT